MHAAGAGQDLPVSEQRDAANQAQVLKKAQRQQRIGIGDLHIMLDLLDAAQTRLQLAAYVACRPQSSAAYHTTTRTHARAHPDT